MSETTIRPLVLYHANCADGFAAAWAAWRRFGTGADYVAVNYGEPPPIDSFVRGREVFILDFSYSRPVLEDMASAARRLVVIDHHKSAAEDLGEYIKMGVPVWYDVHGTHIMEVHFDNDHSGCVLAWRYFFPDVPVPRLLAFIEDRDLWAWKLADSRAVSAGIASYEHTFALLDRWHEAGVQATQRLAGEGEAILRYQEQLTIRLCKHAGEWTVAGQVVPVVNTPVLQSEVAGRLAVGRPFAACYYRDEQDILRFSLRSDKDGVDVSEVAKTMGGGGHKHAAGFECGRGGTNGDLPQC